VIFRKNQKYFGKWLVDPSIAAMSTCASGGHVAALLLVPAAPVIWVACLLVRLTSPGPALYRQTRVGKGGQQFTMYRIRTMRADAEAMTGPVWASDNDERITPVGRFRRRLHLDELPQLVNVVRGEMDLVGPRPERPEFTQRLAREALIAISMSRTMRLRILPVT
jgi:lipopolysaccharide/colanic/teichoic acid biosynthesis glycosyltransferase